MVTCLSEKYSKSRERGIIFCVPCKSIEMKSDKVLISAFKLKNSTLLLNFIIKGVTKRKLFYMLDY